MRTKKRQSCSELIEYIDKIGFLPLLRMGIIGWSAEEVMNQEFQYTPLPDGGWEWPLWKWKGTILQESGCAYGKFFDKKAAFISRELRAACGFTGPKMRGRFDTYVSRLEMGGYIVTEDFIYPHDRHGREYGWGWSLLTTPEALFKREACHPDRTPQESRERMVNHFRKIMPHTDDSLFNFLLK